MDIKQVAEILNEEGKSIIYQPNKIVEAAGYYENFYQLEKIDGAWEYSGTDFENRNGPEKIDIQKFSTEEEAAKYFFLKRLYRYYFNKYIITNTAAYETKSVDDIKKVLENIGVPQSYFSFNKKQPQSILGKVDKNKIVISYVDKNKDISFSTLPIDIERGNFIFYRFVYTLFLLKKVEKKLLDRNIINGPFTDDDIILFIK